MANQLGTANENKASGNRDNNNERRRKGFVISGMTTVLDVLSRENYNWKTGECKLGQ
jgi:hypothetical protein